MYRVIHQFHDLEDFTETKAGRIYHEYRPGEMYPRKGVTPSEARIEFLAGSQNALGTPLIEPAGMAGKPEQPEVPAELSEVQEQPEIPAEEPKPKKARKRKTEA